MKWFDLQEYLNNPNRKVITRDGRSVRIICTDRNPNYPIIALIGETAEIGCYTKTGTYADLFEGSDGLSNDLFFAPEKKEGWVNIYRIMPGDIGNIHLGRIYPSKEAAEAMSKKCIHQYITTIKIEWEG